MFDNYRKEGCPSSEFLGVPFRNTPGIPGVRWRRAGKGGERESEIDTLRFGSRPIGLNCSRTRRHMARLAC